MTSADQLRRAFLLVTVIIVLMCFLLNLNEELGGNKAVLYLLPILSFN